MYDINVNARYILSVLYDITKISFINHKNSNLCKIYVNKKK